MLNDEKGDALPRLGSIHDNRPSEQQRDHTPVVAYDPHFGVLLPYAEGEDFDEMMWERAA